MSCFVRETTGSYPWKVLTSSWNDDDCNALPLTPTPAMTRHSASVPKLVAPADSSANSAFRNIAIASAVLLPNRTALLVHWFSTGLMLQYNVVHWFFYTSS